MSDSNDVISFGCRLNIYESSVIENNLAKSNTKNTAVFNTCAVTAESTRQAKQAIRKFHRENPSKNIIVTGCAAQINPEDFSKIDGVNKVIGNEEKLHLKNYQTNQNQLDTEKVLVNDIMSIKETANHMVGHFANKARAFLQVQNGCDHRCTFCIIPYARGNSRSVPIGVVTQQVQNVLNLGYKEIVFTGVDISAYGQDLPGKPTLAQMIKRLLMQVPNIERLRISSIDVAEIDAELFDLMAYEKRIMPHFHISLQAGDNMILKRMKRRHNRQQVIDFCSKMKQLRVDAAFGADIIAGFPTESEEIFENTKSLIKEANLVYLHVFPYSERDGTPAARMPKIPKQTRKERARILIKEGEEQKWRFFESYKDKIISVLLERDDFGHSENFMPIHLTAKHLKGSIVKAQILRIDREKNKIFAQILN